MKKEYEERVLGGWDTISPGPEWKFSCGKFAGFAPAISMKVCSLFASAYLSKRTEKKKRKKEECIETCCF